MDKVLRGLTLCSALTVAFLFLACTPNQNIRKDQTNNRSASGYQTDDEFFNGNQDPDVAQDNANIDGMTIGDNADSGVKSSNSSNQQDFRLKKPQFDESGMASWYGREFQGKKTASGEPFEMNEFTAAHKNYPFGTILLIKNLENGKSVRVRVNDRGPYQGRRVIDMSYAAAKQLDILNNDETMVGIQVLRRGEDSAVTANNITSIKGFEPVSGEFDSVPYDNGDSSLQQTSLNNVSMSGNFTVQAGAFYSKHNAEELKSKIEGIVNYQVNCVQDNDLIKVKVEGIHTRAEADRCKKQLNSNNIEAFVVEN